MQWKLRRVGLTEAALSLLTKRSLASGPSGRQDLLRLGVVALREQRQENYNKS